MSLLLHRFICTAWALVLFAKQQMRYYKLVPPSFQWHCIPGSLLGSKALGPHPDPLHPYPPSGLCSSLTVFYGPSVGGTWNRGCPDPQAFACHMGDLAQGRSCACSEPVQPLSLCSQPAVCPERNYSIYVRSVSSFKLSQNLGLLSCSA